jgi:hypothetical protein
MLLQQDMKKKRADLMGESANYHVTRCRIKEMLEVKKKKK